MVVTSFRRHILCKIMALTVCLTFIWQSFGPIDEVRAQSANKIALSEEIKVPTRYGEIVDSFKGSLGKTIIHIRDAHCDYSAQNSISGMLGHFRDVYGIDLIALEGGSGNYDLSVFTDIKDSSLREKVADYFVKQGEVNGAEFYAINNPEKITLYGIEEPALYIENLNTYRDSLKFKDKALAILKAMALDVSKQKDKIYPADFRGLDKKMRLFKEDKIGFEEYAAAIAAHAKKNNIDMSEYTNISRFYEAVESENSVNMKEAERERNILIDLLNKRLSKKYLEELVTKTVAFNDDEISVQEYYPYLLAKAELCGIELDKMPNLTKYTHTAKKINNVDKKALEKEFKALEEKMCSSFLKTDEQKALCVLDKKIFILDRLFSVGLVKDDWDYYITHRDEFDLTSLRGVPPLFGGTTKQSLSSLNDYRLDMEKFYSLSLKRDDVFLDKISSKLKKEKQKNIILVTGGFHQDNLKKLFQNKGYSYIEVLPRIEKQDGENPYFGLLSGGMDPVARAISVRQSSLQVASYLSTELKLQDREAFEGAVNTVKELLEKGTAEFGSLHFYLSANAAGAIAILDHQYVHVSGEYEGPIAPSIAPVPVAPATSVVNVRDGRIIRIFDRDVVVVMTEGGEQAFYRSTGQNSRMPGQWLPFEGVSPNKAIDTIAWFNKGRFDDIGLTKTKPVLYRYGTDELKSIGEALDAMNLPVGEEVSEVRKVNDFIGSDIAKRFNEIYNEEDRDRPDGNKVDDEIRRAIALSAPSAPKLDLGDLTAGPNDVIMVTFRALGRVVEYLLKLIIYGARKAILTKVLSKTSGQDKSIAFSPHELKVLKILVFAAVIFISSQSGVDVAFGFMGMVAMLLGYKYLKARFTSALPQALPEVLQQAIEPQVLTELKNYLKDRGNNDKEIEKAAGVFQLGESGQLILEIGCGRGIGAHGIARNNPDIGVIATDIYDLNSKSAEYRNVAQMWEYGKLDAQKSSLDNLAVLRAGAEVLRDIPDNSLDCILLINPEKEAVEDLLSEKNLMKKLKPGGEIILKPTGDLKDLPIGEGFEFIKDTNGPVRWGVNLVDTAYFGTSDSVDIYVYKKPAVELAETTVPAEPAAGKGFITKAIRLWNLWNRENKDDFESEANNLEQNNYIVITGDRTALFNAIERINKGVPLKRKAGVADVIGLLAENVEQHGGQTGTLIVKSEDNKLYIAMMDIGVGFSVIEIYQGNRFQKAKDSAGKGIALQRIASRADKIELYSNDYWQVVRKDRQDEEEGVLPETMDGIAGLKGALIFVTMDLSATATAAPRQTQGRTAMSATEFRETEFIKIMGDTGKYKYFNPAVLPNGTLLARRVLAATPTDKPHRSDIAILVPINKEIGGLEFQAGGIVMENAEDPRVMRLGDRLAMTFVRPYNEGHNWNSHLVFLNENGTLSDDDRTYQLGRPGVNNKNTYLVELANGKIAMIDRANLPDVPASIQAYLFNNLEEALNSPSEYWQEHSIESATILKPNVAEGVSHIGFNTMVYFIEEGGQREFIAFIHNAKSVSDTDKEYVTAEVLLDAETLKPLVEPVELPKIPSDYLKGDVSNVLYETGTLVEHDVVISYAGVADSRIVRIKTPITELMKRLHIMPAVFRQAQGHFVAPASAINERQLSATAGKPAATPAPSQGHAGFGIMMKNGYFIPENIFEAEKGPLREMIITNGGIPEGFSERVPVKATIGGETFHFDIAAHDGVMKRLKGQNISLEQFIENCINIRAPTEKDKIAIWRGLAGKTLILDLVERSPNLYGNCKKDGYIYINFAAPLELDIVGISHELMHEAGLFTDSLKDEASLAVEDSSIVVSRGIDLSRIREKLSRYVDTNSVLFEVYKDMKLGGPEAARIAAETTLSMLLERLSARSGLPDQNSPVVQELIKTIENSKLILSSGEKVITFEDYMRICLTGKREGYYSSGKARIGGSESAQDAIAGGIHFKTFPKSLSPAFGKAMAAKLFDLWKSMGRPGDFTIVEMGVGDGTLAKDILDEIQGKYGDLYDVIKIGKKYKMVDVGFGLIGDNLVEHDSMIGRITASATDKLPEVKNGVFISNELPDAFPVHRVRMIMGELFISGIAYNEGRFSERWIPLKSFEKRREIEDYLMRMFSVKTMDEIKAFFRRTVSGVEMDREKDLPINLEMLKWIRKINENLTKGYVITVDYTFPFNRNVAAYMESDRIGGILSGEQELSGGAIRTYGPSMLKNPGKGDATSNPSFDVLANEGETIGLSALPLESQKDFFLNMIKDHPFLADIPVTIAGVQITFKAALEGIEDLDRTFWVLIQAKDVKASAAQSQAPSPAWLDEYLAELSKYLESRKLAGGQIIGMINTINEFRADRSIKLTDEQLAAFKRSADRFEKCSRIAGFGDTLIMDECTAAIEHLRNIMRQRLNVEDVRQLIKEGILGLLSAIENSGGLTTSLPDYEASAQRVDTRINDYWNEQMNGREADMQALIRNVSKLPDFILPGLIIVLDIAAKNPSIIDSYNYEVGLRALANLLNTPGNPLLMSQDIAILIADIIEDAARTGKIENSERLQLLLAMIKMNTLYFPAGLKPVSYGDLLLTKEKEDALEDLRYGLADILRDEKSANKFIDWLLKQDLLTRRGFENALFEIVVANNQKTAHNRIDKVNTKDVIVFRDVLNGYSAYDGKEVYEGLATISAKGDFDSYKEVAAKVRSTETFEIAVQVVSTSLRDKERFVVVSGDYPKDENGEEVMSRASKGPLDSEENKAYELLVTKLKLARDVTHTIGIEEAMEAIRKISERDKPKESTSYFISASILDQLERKLEHDAALKQKLGIGSGVTLEQFLREKTLLDVVIDGKDKKVFLMPYLQATTAGLSRLHLIDILTNPRAKKEDQDDALVSYYTAMGLLSNLSAEEIEKAIEGLRRVSDKALINFLKDYTFRIAIPPVARINLGELQNTLNAMAELWRSL